MKITLPKLHDQQWQVEESPARFKVVRSGRRWGKGVLRVGHGLIEAAKGRTAWWVTPSYSSAGYQEAWKLLTDWQRQIPTSRLSQLHRSVSFPNGGIFQFKTAEEPDSLRGAGVDDVTVDEAAHIKDLQTIWEQVLAWTLVDRHGSATFISTPKGFNYFEKLDARARNKEPDWANFHFPSDGNPFLTPGDLELICQGLPNLVVRQERFAEFLQLAGALFKREWFNKVLARPPALQYSRRWDLAFTEKTSSDCTAGVKAGLAADGTLVVAHVVHGRWEWPEAVSIVKQTALEDGADIPQGIEVVGAQIGFLQTLMRDPKLKGLTFFPIPVTRDKITRALPLIARAEQGKIALVEGDWHQTFVDEHCAFPEGEHDDIVDATSSHVSGKIAGSSPQEWEEWMKAKAKEIAAGGGAPGEDGNTKATEVLPGDTPPALIVQCEPQIILSKPMRPGELEGNIQTATRERWWPT